MSDAIRDGKVRPEAVYAPQLAQLEKSLAASEQSASLAQLEVLREGLNVQVRRDLVKHQVRFFIASFVVLCRAGVRLASGNGRLSEEEGLTDGDCLFASLFHLLSHLLSHLPFHLLRN